MQAVQVAWNRALISDTLAALWFELLCELTSHPTLSTAQFYSLWPKRQHLEPDSWGAVLVPLYSALATAKVLRVRCLSGPDWVDASEGLFDNLLQLPGPDAPRVFRLQWMHMLMQVLLYNISFFQHHTETDTAPPCKDTAHNRHRQRQNAPRL